MAVVNSDLQQGHVWWNILAFSRWVPTKIHLATCEAPKPKAKLLHCGWPLSATAAAVASNFIILVGDISGCIAHFRAKRSDKNSISCINSTVFCHRLGCIEFPFYVLFSHSDQKLREDKPSTARKNGWDLESNIPYSTIPDADLYSPYFLIVDVRERNHFAEDFNVPFVSPPTLRKCTL